MTADEERDTRVLFVGGLLGLLHDSAFRARRTWSNAVIIWRNGERRVTSRGDFAGWAAANDLPSVADEAARRHVPPGHVLAWVEADNEAGAFARFVVVDVFGEARALLASLPPSAA